MFVQGDRTSDRSEGGLGLGLAVVKNVVERHGGRVAAASEGPGKGATFTVWWPLVQGTLVTRVNEIAELAPRHVRCAFSWSTTTSMPRPRSASWSKPSVTNR